MFVNICKRYGNRRKITIGGYQQMNPRSWFHEGYSQYYECAAIVERFTDGHDEVVAVEKKIERRT